MPLIITRRCSICGEQSAPRQYEDDEPINLPKHDPCPLEPIARALCDAKNGRGYWDAWSTSETWEKYGRRAKRIAEALAASGLRIVPEVES